MNNPNNNQQLSIINSQENVNNLVHQLFKAYCSIDMDESNDEMSSILLSILSSFSPSTEQSPSSNTAAPTTTSPPTTTCTDTTIKSVITSFIELRSQYIGNINHRPTSNMNDNNIITNHFSTNNIVFNYSLFHAALLTNSPIIIDAIIPYLNYDFTTLDIPHDQIDRIKEINTVHNNSNEIYPNNYILQAIVDATEQGHFQSIQHLINNYQLSPTILICDAYLYKSIRCTNLLYYSTFSTNPQLIEYLLPLCFKSTNQKILSRLIFNIAIHGHLPLIKQLHNEYNTNLTQIQDSYRQNLLHYAIKVNNIELIDYLIEEIGLSVNNAPVRCILQSAITAHKWNNVKHLINKHNADVEQANSVLKHASHDPTITLDMVDYIITTFNITNDDIIDQSRDSPLYSFAKHCNIIVLKYLIEKYNVNPHCLFDLNNGIGDSLLHVVLTFNNKIKSTQLLEMVKYLCELGLDVNLRGKSSATPIELLLGSSHSLNECRLPIFKLLLEHKAEIRDVDWFIRHAVINNHFSILQYLITTYQPSIDLNNIKPTKIPLLHYIIREQPTIEFITYILSLHTIDINHKDGNGKTPIQYAILHQHLNIDIIKLLIKNGATVTIDDWLLIFGGFSDCCNTYQLFQCVDYFNVTFGFNVETFSSQQHSPSVKTPLFKFSLKKLDFRYSTIKHETEHFNLVIMYRALIHHYKANVNDQNTLNNNNTIFHNLATFNHYELIQFTLLHSFHKPNIYLVNNQGQTFLHILVSHYDRWVVHYNDHVDRQYSQRSIASQWDDVEEEAQDEDDDDYYDYDDNIKLIITDDEHNDRYDNLLKVLDCLIDLL